MQVKIDYSSSRVMYDLLDMYVLFLEYPKIQNMLSPYFTARFKAPWHIIFKYKSEEIAYIIDALNRLLDSNASVRNEIAEYWQLQKKWFKSGHEIQRLRTLTNHRHNGYHNRKQDFLFSGVLNILQEYGEGAFVVHILWKTIVDKYRWKFENFYPYKPRPPLPPEVRKVEKYLLGKHVDYDGFNILQIPTLAGHQPLSIAYFLESFATELSKIHFTKEMYAKYFWQPDGQLCEVSSPECVTRLLNVKLLSHKLAERGDVQEFKQQLEKAGYMKDFTALVLKATDRVIMGENPLLLNYICAHICDKARYGQEIADISFPLPQFTGEGGAELNKFVDTIQNEQTKYLTGRNDELNQALNEIDKEKAMALSNIVATKELMPLPPDILCQRVLTSTEIETVKNACLTELNGKPALRAIKDFEVFCNLLARPEHHILIPGTQYIETQVNTYTTQEMTNQMAKELVSLPRFTAYTKIVQQEDNRQTVKPHKIQTPPLPKVKNPHGELFAIDNGHLRSREREHIEDAIRERQSQWQQGKQPPPESKGRRR